MNHLRIIHCHLLNRPEQIGKELKRVHVLSKSKKLTSLLVICGRLSASLLSGFFILHCNIDLCILYFLSDSHRLSLQHCITFILQSLIDLLSCGALVEEYGR